MSRHDALHSIYELSSSVVPRVLLRADFWFMLGVHLMTWGGYQSGWFRQENYVAAMVSVDWVDLKMLTVMTIFFLAFYVNQCFLRYQQICMSTHRLFAAIYDFTGEARLFLKGAHQRLSTRWLTSCSLLCLADLQDALGDEQWRAYVDQSLVRKNEVEFLRSLTSHQRLLTISHMTAELCKSQLKEEEFLAILASIMNFKECQEEVLDFKKLDLPFSYRHLLSVMVFLTLLLLAYGMALSESAMAPGIFLIMDLVLLGMLDVAAELWDPFSSREFPMQKWTEELCLGLDSILNHEHDGVREQWRAELEDEHLANPNLLAQPEQVSELFKRRAEMLHELEPSETGGEQSPLPPLETLERAEQGLS